MKERFVVQWRSMVNGRTGRGTKEFGREDGRRLVEELNREYPQIKHELIHAPPPGSAREREEEAALSK
jgi:hypothetical protein